MSALHMVLATDGSASSLSAARWVNRMMASQSVEVVLVSVATWPDEAWWGIGGVGMGSEAALMDFDTIQQLWQASQSRAQAALKATAAIMPDCSPSEQLVLTGRPVDALVQYTQEHHPDLIVVGRRGHIALGTLVGSVSFALLQRSTVPVLVVGEEDP
ncbi:MAG: universal stress protein [Sulfobacillus acidophilus]|uniref:Universal stress protein n=1 Tax=Sulfobacillus acidophilus TaxID=53633 RepID=A0A2T2WIY5_9FIRM|nr:MAG: universal stress protein [Sulfobacillus acidophilus]